MTKNKKIGIALLASPWIGYALSFGLYFIARSFTTPLVTLPEHSTDLPSAPPHETTWRLLSVAASLLGTVSVILLFVGTGLGIYFMAKADDEKTALPKITK